MLRERERDRERERAREGGREIRCFWPRGCAGAECARAAMEEVCRAGGGAVSGAAPYPVC